MVGFPRGQGGGNGGCEQSITRVKENRSCLLECMFFGRPGLWNKKNFQKNSILHKKLSMHLSLRSRRKEHGAILDEVLQSVISGYRRE